MALSFDSGLTFAKAFEPAGCITDPICQGSIIALSDGKIVTSGPGSKESRSNLTLYRSDYVSTEASANNSNTHRKLYSAPAISKMEQELQVETSKMEKSTQKVFELEKQLQQEEKNETVLS